MKLLVLEYERRIRTIEQDKREYQEKREHEVRLLYQLLEERKQWQTTKTGSIKVTDRKLEAIDTARIIQRLEREPRAEEGSCSG